jgi:hypothetical protein
VTSLFVILGTMALATVASLIRAGVEARRGERAAEF